MKTDTLTRAVKRVDDFYKSIWSFVVFLSMGAIITIVQFTLFATGTIPTNGFFVYDDKAWISWIVMTLSTLTLTIGFIGSILTTRGSMKFFPYTMSWYALTLVVNVLTGMVIITVVNFLSMFSVIVRFLQWKEQMKNESKGIARKNLFTVKNVSIVLSIVMIFLIFGAILISTVGNSIYPPEFVEWERWFDLAGAAASLAGVLFMNLRTRWAFPVYTLSKIFSIAIFIHDHNYIVVTQILIFSSMDLTGFMSWTNQERIQKELREQQAQEA